MIVFRFIFEQFFIGIRPELLKHQHRIVSNRYYRIQFKCNDTYRIPDIKSFLSKIIDPITYDTIIIKSISKKIIAYGKWKQSLESSSTFIIHYWQNLFPINFHKNDNYYNNLVWWRHRRVTSLTKCNTKSKVRAMTALQRLSSDTPSWSHPHAQKAQTWPQPDLYTLNNNGWVINVIPRIIFY